MYPRKVFRDTPGLVALYRADEVPFDRQIDELGHLHQSFLKIVFTKYGLPSGEGLTQTLCGIGFACSEERDFLRLPPCPSRDLPDAIFYLLQTRCDSCGIWFQFSAFILQSPFHPLRG